MGLIDGPGKGALYPPLTILSKYSSWKIVMSVTQGQFLERKEGKKERWRGVFILAAKSERRAPSYGDPPYQACKQEAVLYH